MLIGEVTRTQSKFKIYYLLFNFLVLPLREMNDAHLSKPSNLCSPHGGADGICTNFLPGVLIASRYLYSIVFGNRTYADPPGIHTHLELLACHGD